MYHYCKDCKKEKKKTKLVLVHGFARLESDSEPYESGEEINLDLDIEPYIIGMYCPICGKLKSIWQE